MKNKLDQNNPNRDISPKIIVEEYIEPEISNHEIQHGHLIMK